MASIIITGINIKHAGNFIVDTVPPSGTVVLNNGDPFTKTQRVKVNIDAQDATTDIKNFDIRNTNVKTDINGNIQLFPQQFIEGLEYTPEFFWNLPETEGVKRVEVRLRDYADNVSEFKANSSAVGIYTLFDEEVNDSSNIDGNIFTSTDDSNIYIYTAFNRLVGNLDGAIVDLQKNNNVLYVAVNDIGNGDYEVYSLISNEFFLNNSFTSPIVDMASYLGSLYVILEDGDLWKKSGSTWEVITNITSTVVYIDGRADYLYIVSSDTIDVLLYNGTSFKAITILDQGAEEEYEESSSSTDSSLSSSSTRNLSSSSLTESDSSSSINSSSSLGSSLSTEIMTSSSSSTEQLPSSSSSSESSFSSESLSSFEEFVEGCPTGVGTTALWEVCPEDISSSTEDVETEESSSDSSDSSSTGDPCECDVFHCDSKYLTNFQIYNLSDKYDLLCNLHGRLVYLGDGLNRVILYHSPEMVPENEICRSMSFPSFSAPQVNIFLFSVNNSGTTGYVDYQLIFESFEPEEFMVICEEGDNSSSSTGTSSSDTGSSSQSLDLMRGNGTESRPFEINNYRDLQLVNQAPFAYFVLNKTIDALNYSTNDNGGFLPIGNDTVPFSGNFDGKGFTIRNLYINRPNFDDTEIKRPQDFIEKPVLDGFALGESESSSSNTISSSSSIGSSDVGLFGYVRNAVIKNLCLEEIFCTGGESVGGLAGRASDSLIDGVSVVGLITGTIQGEINVGGLIGTVENECEINNSYSRIAVQGNIVSGGAFGSVSNRTIIFNCYSVEAVSGTTDTGGLIGINDDTGEVISSYWDVERSGVLTSAGGEGKTSSEMQLQGTYVGYLFGRIWAINEDVNNGYPFLVACACELESSSSSSSSSSFSSSSSPSSPSSLTLEPGEGSSFGFGIMSRFVRCPRPARFTPCEVE